MQLLKLTDLSQDHPLLIILNQFSQKIAADILLTFVI